MITLISSKKLGVYKIMRNTVLCIATYLRMILTVKLSFITRIRFHMQMSINFNKQIENIISTAVYQYMNIPDHA